VFRIEQNGRMSLGRPKAPTKEGSAPDEEEEEEEEDFSCCDMTQYGQVASSSETSLCLYLSTHCYIPVYIHLRSCCHENLTSHNLSFKNHEE